MYITRMYESRSSWGEKYLCDNITCGGGLQPQPAQQTELEVQDSHGQRWSGKEG
jgi:hypothetical protein